MDLGRNFRVAACFFCAEKGAHHRGTERILLSSAGHPQFGVTINY